MSIFFMIVWDGEIFVVLDDQLLVEFICEYVVVKWVVIQVCQCLSGGVIQENWLLDLLIEGGFWVGVWCWVLCSDVFFVLFVSFDCEQEFEVL